MSLTAVLQINILFSISLKQPHAILKSGLYYVCNYTRTVLILDLLLETDMTRNLTTYTSFLN